MSRDTFVLRRPPSAFGPLAYYPPNAIKRAEWLTAEAADAARVNLTDAPAWTVMTKKDARAEDTLVRRGMTRAAIREALTAAGKAHGKRAFTETPGDLMTFPQLRDGVIVPVPVVVVQIIPDGPARGFVAKFADNALRHLPHDWPLDPCGVDDWLAYAKREGAQ